MKKLWKRSANSDLFWAYVEIMQRIRKVVVVILLIGIFGSLFPQNVKAITYTESVSPTAETDVTSSLPSTTDIGFDANAVAIDSEVESKRTLDSKTFRKVDGTYFVAVYDGIIHFEEDNRLKNINNTLEYDKSTDTYGNIANNYDFHLPNTMGNESEFTLSYGEYSLQWTVLKTKQQAVDYTAEKATDDLRTLSMVNTFAAYNNIFDGVALEYLLGATQVKENIVLSQYISDFSLSFSYDCINLSIRTSSNSIQFISETGEVIFSIGGLFMVDADERLSDAVKLQVNSIDATEVTITVIPDDVWMKSAHFPVTIDPSVTITKNSSFIDDTFVSESQPDTVCNLLNGSPYPYMPISNNVTGARFRGLLKFDMPSESNKWFITYARMTLTRSTKVQGTQINLYRNTSDFAIDSVTWNNQPAVDSLVEAYHLIGASDSYTFDITGSVKYWQDNPNYGFSLRAENEYQGYNSVLSVDYATTSLRPLIEIGYIERAGLMEYWTYDAQDLGDAGTGYIAENSGYYTNVRNDFDYANNETALSLDFMYGSESGDRYTNMKYGYGWRTQYDVSWGEYSPTIMYVSYGDSHSEFFNDPDACDDSISSEDPTYTYTCFTSEEGSGATFVKKTKVGSTLYFLLSKSGDKYSFASSYWLSSIVYQDDRRIDVYRNAEGRISYIYDLLDNYIQFTYSSTTGLLQYTDLYILSSNQTYHRLIQNRYYYDTYSNLDYIYQRNYFDTANPTLYDTYKRVDYSFTSTHILSNFVNSRNSTMVTYQRTAEKITSYSTTVGTQQLGTISFEYNGFSTIIEDQYGNMAKTIFDVYGHTVCVMDDDGNASFTQYLNNFTDPNPNYNLSNKVISTSPVQNSQMNLLKNGSFDTTVDVAQDTEGGWYKYGYLPSGTLAYSSESVSGIGTNNIYNVTRTGGYPGVPFSLRQKITLDSGEYTLRGRIKNPGVANQYGEGAYIAVTGASSSSEIVYVYLSSSYVDVSVTFTITQDNTVVYVDLCNLSYSTATFDNLQIDTGFVDSRYNYISNPSFESSLSGWTYPIGVQTTVSDDFRDITLGDTAIELMNSPMTERTLTQTIRMKVSTGDVLSFGTWIKSCYTGYNDILKIRLGIVKYTGGMTSATYWTEFSPTTFVTDWQYVMGSVEVTGGVLGYYGNIYFEVVYKSENNVLVDGAQLYKEATQTFIAYNVDGNVDTISTSSVNEISITYDEDDSSKVVQVDDNGTIADIDDSIVYNPNDSIQSITENNVRTSFWYTNGEVTLVEVRSLNNDHLYRESTTFIHSNQYQSSKTNKYGDTVDYNYNTKNTLLESIGLPNGATQYFVYDRSGMLTSTYINNNLGLVSYTYDSQDRLSTVAVNGLVYQLIYNSLGQVTSITVAGVSLISTDYVEKVVDGVTYYTNMVSSEQYANGNTFVFHYNEKDQLSEIQYKSTPISNEVLKYSYEYDSLGRLIIFRDAEQSKTYYYLYNTDGSISRITDESNNYRSYSYDAQGQVDGYSYRFAVAGSTVTRTVQFNYDYADKRMESVSFVRGGTTFTKTYQFDAYNLERISGVLMTSNIGSIFQVSYDYDDEDVIVDFEESGLSQRINKITYSGEYDDILYGFTFDYEFDSLGNVTQELFTKTVYDYNNPPVITLLSIRTYGYDTLNQLIRENVCTDSCSNNPIGFTNVFAYNANGNRTSQLEYIYTPAGTTPTVLLNTYAYTYSTTWKDQLLNANGYDYAYDNQGNLTSMIDAVAGVTIAMSYEGRTMLSYYVEDAGQATTSLITYEYNDEGYRIYKNVDGNIHTYFLDGDRVLVENNNGFVLYYTYDDVGKLISVNFLGAEYFYQRNILGDIVGLYNEYGQLVVSYEYDAFGNIISTNDVSGCYLSKFNPYRYRGYRYDEETGLYYLNSRYYNPETGRFLCADGYIGSTGQLLSTNMYTYAMNNPISYYDPTGYISIVAEIAIGMAIDIGLSVALTALTAGAAAAFDFLVDILSEVVSTIVINLLNKVEWCLNIGENVITSILMGGAIAVVGGFLIKFVVKRLNLGGIIDNVLKKIFKKTDNILDSVEDVGTSVANRADDVKLYRAVSPAEFDGALSSQTLSISKKGMEGKWFATTIDDAKKWASKLPDNSQILEVGIDGSALSKAYYDPILDDIGPAYYFQNIDDINIAIRYIKGVWS